MGGDGELGSEVARRLDEKIDLLDEITLTDYSHRVDVHIGILIDPENDPEEWRENLEFYLGDKLSNLPHSIKTSVSERDTDA